MRIITGLEAEWVDTGDGEYLVEPLSTSEYLNAVDDLAERFGSAAVLLCKEKVKDWRKVEDQDGKAIKFDSELLDRLPPKELAKLSGMIIRNSKFTESERKN